MTRSEWWLMLLLRAGGVVTASAVLAVFLPGESMAAIHRALGLGELPAAPITGYLTRSLSAMYALHGVVLLALSLDVRRHLRAVRWVGWGTVTLGALLIGIDVHAAMPVWWTLAEGPWVVVAGLLVVWLCARAGRERSGRERVGRIALKKARP